MINTRTENDYWDPARKGFITNYPNFMQWKRLTPEDLSKPAPLNLYLHSPYCIQRCSYCYYKTVNLRGAEKKERMTRYVDAICKEIELAAETYHLQDRPILSVYYGGGTPSLLSDEHLLRIDQTLRNHFKIEGAEYTVEAEPVTLTEEKLLTLLKMGANRISMGVQSFDTDIIKASHRLDDEKKVIRAVKLAKSSGAVINIDLMSGLAGETARTWEHSVRSAIESDVESITVYKTELYNNTEYYRGLKNNTIDLPSDDEELRYMQHAMDALEGASYIPWSFYTFTKGGAHVHVHSPSVFRGDDIYSFGVSAFGRLGAFLFQNSNEEERYIERIESGRLAIQRGHHLNALDSMIRDVVLSMKLVRFDLNYFKSRHGIKLDALCAPILHRLIEEDFIRQEDAIIHLTRKGILYGDFVGKSVARALMELAN